MTYSQLKKTGYEVLRVLWCHYCKKIKGPLIKNFLNVYLFMHFLLKDM